MREKLMKLMKSEGLSSSRFAEILDIQPSSISHILSGRNKPSFDFLVKIFKRFPSVNPDWLLLDDPNMYRNDKTNSNIATGKRNETEPAPADRASDISYTTDRTESNIQSTFRPTKSIFDQLPNAPKQTSIERIIVLYSDKSFEAFSIK